MGLYLGNQKFKVNFNSQIHNLLIPKYTNRTFRSIAGADKTIYNGTGYKNGYRLSSSGVEKEQTNATTFGFIPATENDIIRLAGVSWVPTVSNGYCYITFYDENFTLLSTLNCYQNQASPYVSNIANQSSSTGVLNTSKSAHTITIDENGVILFNLSYIEGRTFSYIRISAQGDGKDAIITINEEI